MNHSVDIKMDLRINEMLLKHTTSSAPQKQISTGTGKWLVSRRDHAPARSKLWSAVSVALTLLGCSLPGPQADESVADKLREKRRVNMQGVPGKPEQELSILRGGVANGPLLILVHGTPGEAIGWADYLLYPPPGMEVIALDRPGFGQSSPEGAVTSLAAQAEAVAALLPRDGRQVVLLGHSLGGPIVAQVAAMHPDRISAVVLLAASLDPELESIHPMQWVGAWSPVRFFLPRAMRNANAELIALKDELQKLRGLLPAIRAKIIIVHGTKDDLVPVANVAYMQARLTGAACVKTMLLEERNHFLPWNSVDIVRNAILQAATHATGSENSAATKEKC